MTEQEKQILLQDLCGRLPYKVKIEANICPRALFPMDVVAENLPKPYLRPMLSMTEEEKCEYNKLLAGCEEKDQADYNITTLVDSMLFFVIDWLNAHHFDYRGLIEKGLALEAPKGMYKTKTE